FIKVMGDSVRDRPVDDLSPDQLVVRYLRFISAPRVGEHARLRSALERAVETQPNHALAWASLSALYDAEVSLGLNEQPDARRRSGEAARRAVQIDPQCQPGWMRLVATHFQSRDQAGMQLAAQRALSLNPFNQSVSAFVGSYVAFSGDWDTGIPLVRRAM